MHKYEGLRNTHLWNGKFRNGCCAQLKVLIPCEDVYLVPCHLVSTSVVTCASTCACIFRSNSLRSASQSAVTRWSSLRLLSLGKLRKRHGRNFGLNIVNFGLNTTHLNHKKNLDPLFRCLSFMFTLSDFEETEPAKIKLYPAARFQCNGSKRIDCAVVILKGQIFLPVDGRTLISMVVYIYMYICI